MQNNYFEFIMNKKWKYIYVLQWPVVKSYWVGMSNYIKQDSLHKASLDWTSVVPANMSCYQPKYISIEQWSLAYSFDKEPLFFACSRRPSMRSSCHLSSNSHTFGRHSLSRLQYYQRSLSRPLKFWRKPSVIIGIQAEILPIRRKTL